MSIIGNVTIYQIFVFLYFWYFVYDIIKTANIFIILSKEKIGTITVCGSQIEAESDVAPGLHSGIKASAARPDPARLVKTEGAKAVRRRVFPATTPECSCDAP